VKKHIKVVKENTLTGKRTLIVAFDKKNYVETKDSIKEIESLSKTLKLNVVKTIILKEGIIYPSTYIGKGKLFEIKKLVEGNKISMIVFEKELSPVQQRNIENILNVSIIDRTLLILYIFADHAKTKEGKIQVELAQLSYILPRLTGHGIDLSRLGGGLGTRGPGEMKLEVYRRRIKERIGKLKKQIKEIEKHRSLLRNSKKRKKYLSVSLIGYTNVGKSTLLNKLSSSNLYVANKLFSTLDPATRLVYIDDNKYCLVSDTVGLLYNIPHHLIEAFKSTLEEIKYADLLLCIYDVSINIEKQKSTVYQVLKLLKVDEKPRIEVFNKIDLLEKEELNLMMMQNPENVFISSLTKDGFDILRERMLEVLYGIKVEQK